MLYKLSKDTLVIPTAAAATSTGMTVLLLVQKKVSLIMEEGAVIMGGWITPF